MVSVLAPSILGGAVTSINLLSIALRLHQKQALTEPDIIRFDTAVRTLPYKSFPWKGYFPLCVPTQTVSGTSDYLNAAIHAWKNDQTVQTMIHSRGFTVQYRLPYNDDKSMKGKNIYVMKAPRIMDSRFEYHDLSIKWPSRDLDSFDMAGMSFNQCVSWLGLKSNPEMFIVLVSVYKLEWDTIGDKWMYSTTDTMHVHVVLCCVKHSVIDQRLIEPSIVAPAAENITFIIGINDTISSYAIIHEDSGQEVDIGGNNDKLSLREVGVEAKKRYVVVILAKKNSAFKAKPKSKFIHVSSLEYGSPFIMTIQNCPNCKMEITFSLSMPKCQKGVIPESFVCPPKKAIEPMYKANFQFEDNSHEIELGEKAENIPSLVGMNNKIIGFVIVHKESGENFHFDINVDRLKLSLRELGIKTSWQYWTRFACSVEVA
ncbi:UNVERIFIED_CONTAM: hypothetical protein HDU68_005445 [Siphonaria sp. JEL0065]|nr:hypothetical protein HDU68_005445 [Siphonaria sp. JEL0065]